MADMKKKYPQGDIDVRLIVRVGTEPQPNTIQTSNGSLETVNFRAVASQYAGPDKDPQDYWFSVRVAGLPAGFAKTLQKGDLISLKHGEFAVREYQDKSGANRFDFQYSVRNAGTIALLNRANRNGSNGQTASVPTTTSNEAGDDGDLPPF